ncbi:MAG: helix-turn-helix transcriptional regulator [Acidobacteriia bacterium]|nr:helix-turn-helix transcriptional regulator [Terriglobia bacterium]
MAKHGLSQDQLARRARVSQSTVSRALRGAPSRHSQARHRLLSCARIGESAVDSSTKGGIRRVVKAFNEIWDGSDAHADAVVNIIGALAGLRPVGSTGRRKGS